MLPSLAAVLRAHDFLVRRHRLDNRRDEGLITDALVHAAELAGGRAEDEPAALLFALSVRGRALGAGWELVPWVLAQNQARALGLVIQCDEAEMNALVDLRLNVAQGRAAFEDVRAWVAAHVRPLG